MGQPQPITNLAGRIATQRFNKSEQKPIAAFKSLAMIVNNEISVMYEIHWPAWLNRINTAAMQLKFLAELANVLAKNNITESALRYAMEIAPTRKFYPYPVPHDWLQMSKERTLSGLPSVDEVFADIERYWPARRDPEQLKAFEWHYNVSYWVMQAVKDDFYQKNLGEGDLKMRIKRELNQWAEHLSQGGAITAPAKMLNAPEPKLPTYAEQHGLNVAVPSKLQARINALKNKKRPTAYQAPVEKIVSIRK